MTDPTHGTAGTPDDEPREGPVVRDRRRLDPQTGQVREQPAPAPSDGGAPEEPQAPDEVMDDVSVAQGLVDELRTDLQRLQAEYVNYRRRVDRDRDVARAAGQASVIEALFPVLDDIHFAREHGELAEGPFGAIAEKLQAALSRFGLEQFGSVGEPFDPAVHEALMHSHSADVTETTVVQVLQPGYRQGERVLRAARVAVADPE
ncbi:MAG: nucleotide exchange factor GrpE [Actinomycetes bacterium]